MSAKLFFVQLSKTITPKIMFISLCLLPATNEHCVPHMHNETMINYSLSHCNSLLNQ